MQSDSALINLKWQLLVLCLKPVKSVKSSLLRDLFVSLIVSKLAAKLGSSKRGYLLHVKAK